jgi:predicted RNA binding protein YcfA (HicA-like mRNA interferase family)
MSKSSKSLDRITRKPTPADVRWAELKSALEGLGFDMLAGKGSRRKFFHRKRDVLICLHEPHPAPEVGKAALEDVRELLKLHGFIERGSE